MGNVDQPNNEAFYRALPKVELHRHLEGSLRLRTMMDVSRAYNLGLLDADYLRSMVQVNADDPYTSQNFLSKFQILRKFYRSPEIIQRVTWEAIEDATADNVVYMELRFTPVALSRAEGFPLGEVIDWVSEAAHSADQKFGCTTRLIASVNRHESVELAEEVIALAADRMNAGIVGVDMAGDEAQFSTSPFHGVFAEAQQSDLHITIHAGEWGGAENVANAITELGAERIGHGVRVLEDPSVVSLARERRTAFEICVTSNIHSGVVTSLDAYPLTSMLAEGLNVTVNTDDPSISQITLSDEYCLVCEKLGLSQEQLQQRVIAAAQASFLPQKEREELVSKVEQQFNLTGGDGRISQQESKSL
jgi:adenosine deaminase